MRYLLLITIGLVMVTSPIYGQSIYEDVQRLKKYVQKSGDDLRFGSFEGESEYVKILKKYVPDTDRARLNASGSFYDYFEEVGNTFLKIYFNEEGKMSSNTMLALEAEAKKLPASIGALNVTTIADGIAKFLVERANQELSIAFFDRFRKEIEKNVELSTLFPVSARLLKQMDPLQYSYMLNALKESFHEDISNLVTNIERLVETQKYQDLITKYEQLKFIYVGLEAAQIVSKLSNGTHPADVIDGLGRHKKIEKVSGNLANSLKVISLLSSSIRNTTGEGAYVSITELKENIFEKPVTQKIFLGLLYQRSLDIKFELNDEAPLLFSEMIKEVSSEAKQFENLYTSLSTNLQVVKRSFEEIESTPKSERNYLDYYNFFETIPDFIDSSFKEVEKLLVEHATVDNDYRESVNTYVYIARRGSQIYKNVNERNYASAIVNFIQIYDFAIGSKLAEITKVQQKVLNEYLECLNEIKTCNKSTKTKITDLLKEEATFFGDLTFDLNKKADRKKFRKMIRQYFAGKVFLDERFDQKFFKYGMFIVNVAQAENSDEVQAAIEAAVLPAGSSRIKRHAKFNISINSYLGGFGGYEFLRDATNDKGRETFGIFAPIGISGSWGVGESLKSSVSAFVSVIDLGAFASFRIQNDVEELPEFQLQNIIAPGGYLAWNIGGTPLTILAGAQLGPQLRKIEVNGSFEESSAWRFQAALTVDIPMFNLSTKPWN